MIRMQTYHLFLKREERAHHESELLFVPRPEMRTSGESCLPSTCWGLYDHVYPFDLRPDRFELEVFRLPAIDVADAVNELLEIVVCQPRVFCFS